MPWIEGIGDEVTITVSIFLGICVLLAAWISTGIRDIPFISVIIVQLTRRQRRRESDDNVAESPSNSSVTSDNRTVTDGETGSIDPLISVSDNVNEVPELSENSDELDVPDNDSDIVEELGANSVESESKSNISQKVPGDQTSNTLNQSSDNTTTVGTSSVPRVENLKPSELRHRRLQFFSGSPKTCSDEDQKSQPSENVCSCDDEPEVLSENRNNETGRESNISISQSVENVSSESTGNLNDVEHLSNDNETLPGNESEPRDSTGEIRIRIKFLNDTQRLVTTPPDETIGNFRRRHFEEELSQSKLVRFIFNGQDLRNDASTLQSLNIGDNSVLHCLVTQQPETRDTRNMEDGSFDIGVFMFPLFGLLLGIVWYMRVMYRQFFNVTSTLTLGGITFLFVAALMSSFRGHRPHEHVD